MSNSIYPPNFCLFLNQFIYFSAYPCILLSTYLFICLPIYLTKFTNVNLLIYLFFLSTSLIHPFIYPCIYPSISLPLYLSVSIFLLIYLSICHLYLSTCLLYSELYEYCLSLFTFWSWFRVVFLVVMRMSEPRLQIDLLHCKPKYTPE